MISIPSGFTKVYMICFTPGRKSCIRGVTSNRDLETIFYAEGASLSMTRKNASAFRPGQSSVRF
jgi:hypothetical protein